VNKIVSLDLGNDFFPDSANINEIVDLEAIAVTNVDEKGIPHISPSCPSAVGNSMEVAPSEGLIEESMWSDDRSASK
jgi:hypothetical protein